MSVILLNHEIVHYEVLGRGRPVILLHGWVGSWRYWVPAMQAASISCRVYAIDMWGFGDTSKDQKLYSLDQQVRLISTFLEQMGIGKVALVGHGLGAMVALMYATNHPDFVDRVMIVGAPLAESLVNNRLRTTSPVELAAWLLNRSVLTEPVLSDAAKVDPAAVQMSFNYLNSIAFDQIWSRSNTPCLIVHGQNDPAVSAPGFDRLDMYPENTHQIVFEESGHFPMLDQSSKFNRLLIDFLSLPSGKSPRDLQLKEEWKRRVR